MQNIANKVVIITGASSSIGEATALKLAAEVVAFALAQPDDTASAGYRQLYDAYEIPAARVAEVVAFALAQPDDTNISEFTIGPTIQPW